MIQIVHLGATGISSHVQTLWTWMKASWKYEVPIMWIHVSFSLLFINDICEFLSCLSTRHRFILLPHLKWFPFPVCSGCYAVMYVCPLCSGLLQCGRISILSGVKSTHCTSQWVSIHSPFMSWMRIRLGKVVKPKLIATWFQSQTNRTLIWCMVL